MSEGVLMKSFATKYEKANFKKAIFSYSNLIRISLLLLVLICSNFDKTYSQEVIDKGRFSGMVFGDYYYNSIRDGSLDSTTMASVGKQEQNGFIIRRINLVYDYDFTNEFTTRLRIESDNNALTSDGKFALDIKDAYIKWQNIFSGSDLTIGIQPTFAFDLSESVWGNRYIKETQMDHRGIESSRDFGVSLKGSLFGDLKYGILFGNNSSVKQETDKYKRYSANLQYNPTKALSFLIFADLKAKKDVFDTDKKEYVSNNEIVYSFFVGYNEKENYSFGAEAFMQVSSNGMKDIASTSNPNALINKNALGFSVFANYYFAKDFYAFARFDSFDPNTNAEVKADSKNHIIVGCAYKPTPRFSISPNVLLETYEKKEVTIGNATTTTEFKSSVTPRLTFFYTF